MTNQIVSLANQVVRGAAFTKLKKQVRKSGACFLIVQSREFALYASYSSNAVYAVDNQGSAYKLA